MLRLIVAIVAIISLTPATSTAQQGPSMGDQFFKDSLRQTPYPYTLPILGQKVRELGQDLPYPMGGMFNFIHQQTRLELTSLKVGFGDLPLTELDFVTFDPIENVGNVYNFRFDNWILPFLNVYGIYAYGNGTAEIPMTFPIQYDIKTSPVVSTFGGGIVLAYGIKNFFGAYNLNLSWSNTSALDDLVYGRVQSIRVGRIFNLKKRYHSISISVGAQKQVVDRLSAGQITFGDIFDNLDQSHLDDLRNQIQDEAQNWYDDLSLAQKLVVDRLVETMEDWFDGVNVRDVPIHYSFEKEVIGEWSFQLGAQYNHGKRWWYRMEGGFGKGRTQLLISANYRFGIKKKEFR